MADIESKGLTGIELDLGMAAGLAGLVIGLLIGHVVSTTMIAVSFLVFAPCCWIFLGRWLDRRSQEAPDD
jgi:uncharacterized membrane protein YkgB